MNGLVFLLPFVLIATLGLSQNSYAAESITGINYFDVTNPDGTHTWSSHHEYILDNGIYVPYVQNGLTVNSKIGDVTLNQDGSYTWNNKFDDRIVGKYADISDLTTWIYPESLNNAVPILSFVNDEFHANKFKAGVAGMDYKYVFNNGQWKTELVVTNLSSLTTKVFGFDQTINLNTDNIEIDGRIYNIDDFDGVVLNKLFLDHNEGKILNLMNGVNFDFDLGYENLYSITIHDTGVNSSQLVFDYRTNVILLPNDTLIIDPTFTSSSPTYNGRLYSAASTGTTCAAFSTAAAEPTSGFYRYPSNVNSRCSTIVYDYDITAIPDTAVVKSATFTVTVIDDNTPGTSTESGYLVGLATQASGVSANYNEAILQTPKLTNTGAITLDGGGAGQTISFNAVGIADIEAQLVSAVNFYSFAMTPETWVRSAGTGNGAGNYALSSASFTIVYNESPPDAVTDLTSTAISTTTISLDWSLFGAGNGTIVGYQINATTPQTNNPLVWLNDTGSTNTDHVVTGLLANTDYSFRVSAWTEFGNNATGNVYNATTINPTPSQPANLVATSSSISIIGLDWDDSAIPTIDNITGYRIFSESPTGNGWTLEVNDTASSTSSYSDTGLSTKTQYNYMVAGINATGVGSNSTASSAYTWGVPDGITGFTIVTPTASSLTLDYTAATSYGYPVTGYMVYRDNALLSADIGNVTSYANTGLSSGTSYTYAVKALSAFGNSVSFVNATGITSTGPPTGLTVNDCYHTCTTQLNLEWVAPVPGAGINGYRIFSESPIGNGFTTLVSNTTTTTLYYNNTGLTPGVFYNYKVAALNGGVSENSAAFARSPHKLPDSVTDLTITPNALLQFDGAWTQPTLYGTLTGYQINYTTPAGDPVTIYTSTNPGVTAVISGLNPTVEYSFRVSANTYHGINATGNIANATASSEIAVGDLTFDAGTNPDIEPIWYENYVVDSTTNDVQVRYDAALTVDCTVTERLSGNVNTFTGLSETAETGYVYHNFTVTNAGNDILDWDCYDQTDATIKAAYSLTQSESSSGVGGFANVPLFSQMSNFTAGLYGTEGNFAGIDLITLFIVIVSMLGFNRQNPALGVGVMAIMLGAAWYYGLIPWTSGVLGSIAVVIVLAIGQGTKKD